MNRRTVDTNDYPPILYSALKWGFTVDEIRYAAQHPPIGRAIEQPSGVWIQLHPLPGGNLIELGWFVTDKWGDAVIHAMKPTRTNLRRAGLKTR